LLTITSDQGAAEAVRKEEVFMKLWKLTLALSLLAAFSFPAAAQVQMMQLNIPFNFVAAGKAMPAGHYDVKRVPTPNNNTAWLISGENMHATVTTFSVESPKTAHPPSLVFLQAGGRYSLVQIWDDEHYGRQVPRANVKQTLVAQDGKMVQVAAE
jgi:hypothetical protein